MIVDTHAHIDDVAFAEGVSVILDRAREAGVGYVINPGCNLDSSRAAARNAMEHPEVYALVGIHPHDAVGVGAPEFEIISQLLLEPKVTGIGEIGLDYYRDLSPRSDQVKVFRAQLELARERGVPVSVHDRDAHQDTYETVREFAPDLPAVVMHCYSGSAEMARELVKLGCYISFAGPLTYKNARKLAEAASAVPLERMLVETDAPYLPPTPYRGERNEPAYAKEVVKKIAEIKGVSAEEVEQTTTANAIRVFGITPV